MNVSDIFFSLELCPLNFSQQSFIHFVIRKKNCNKKLRWKHRGKKYLWRLLWWLSGIESTCQCRRQRLDLWVGKISWRKEWLLTLVFLPGEFHGQRRLAGYSPWRHKELDTTEHLTLSRWPSSKESSCQCRRHVFDPWSRKIPHAVEQLSPWATTTEPVLWSPEAVTTEACMPYRPGSAIREATAMKSPCTAMKSRPCSPQVEKSLPSNEINKLNYFKRYLWKTVPWRWSRMVWASGQTARGTKSELPKRWMEKKLAEVEAGMMSSQPKS